MMKPSSSSTTSSRSQASEHNGNVHISADRVDYQQSEQHQGEVHINAEQVVVSPQYTKQVYEGLIPDAADHDLRPNPLNAQTPAEFMQLLRDFRVWSGKPSYRTMARKSGLAFGASTFCTVLNQDRLPKQQILRAIILVCDGDSQDLQVWVTAWRKLALDKSQPSLSVVIAN